jgi:hypothetical protein
MHSSSRRRKQEPTFEPPEIGSVQFNNFDEFYRSIPPEGSLGILALGAAGLMAWRRKRREAGLEPEGFKQEKENADG